VEALCDYKSVRYINVRSPRVAAAYWATMGLITIYILAYSVMYQQGYQDTDDVSGTTSVKVKGTGAIGNINGSVSDLLPLDAVDLVQPSLEQESLFVVTSRVITRNQTRSMHCEGNGDIPECTTDNTTLCEQSLFDAFSHGLYTGNCAANGRCEMYSWCPLENDSNPDIINGVGDFTVFVKVDVSFDKFGVLRHNYYDTYGSYPTSGYNLFSVDEMLSEATNGAVTSASQVADRGAIILVKSTWNCNLDRSEDRCNPEWDFKRIDDASHSISSGFNFRTVTYDTAEGSRSLSKLYGIRFLFLIEGTAGKFSVVALTVTLGAGLAYLGIAAIVADIIMLKFLSNSEEIHREKFDDFENDDVTDNVISTLRDLTSREDTAVAGIQVMISPKGTQKKGTSEGRHVSHISDDKVRVGIQPAGDTYRDETAPRDRLDVFTVQDVEMNEMAHQSSNIDEQSVTDDYR